jgi:DNA repair photolyase
MKSKPQLDLDGVSVKGCTIIYAPAGQAGEYAALATNSYRGCGHKCGYCYVPPIIRMDRREFNAGATPRPNFLRLLEKDARKYQALGIIEQVMLSFTTDPYHPGDTSLTRDVLRVRQPGASRSGRAGGNALSPAEASARKRRSGERA